MGKMMTLKKKGKNKSITLSKAEINAFNRQIKQAETDVKLASIEQAALLFTAFAMEEEVINKDPEKIVEMYTKLNDWADHIADHTITINTVVDIINEATGLELIHWEKR
jgi:hypothetical protein